jgi:ATP-binding cassette, subfamily F, member 3
MIEIGLNNIKRNYGFKNILDGVTIEVNSGDVMAIVGRNGCGKSTLLKIIAGEENVDSGMVFTRNGATIGFLQQIPKKVADDITVKDILNLGIKDIMDLQAKLSVLELKMSDEAYANNLNSIMNEYSRLQERYIFMGGYELTEKFSKICVEFKISDEKLRQTYNSLSGGEKTVINLTSILLSNPDILLLDEPTNHLDIQTLEWFEGFLKAYKGTVVIISHDRYFLDKVATKTLLLDDGKGYIYSGNYTYFLEEDERRTLAQFEIYKNQQRQITAMKESAKRLREFGTIGNNELFFKRAKSIEKRLEKLEVLDKPKNDGTKLPLNFAMNDRSGKDVLKIVDLGIVLGEKQIFNDASFQLFYGEKLCLIGKNGSGKSTLINILLGEINQYTGDIKIGSNVKIGYVPQEIYFEDENATILDTFRKCFSGTETDLRGTLAKFMFRGENVFKRVSGLSGGEKVRLKLASLMQLDTNLLILDEPTNHIDIDTREVLEEALQEYKGTLLFISHDRYFINKLAKRVVEIADKKLKSYLGNYDEYKEAKCRIAASGNNVKAIVANKKVIIPVKKKKLKK